MRLPGWQGQARAVPFRYRFRVVGGAVVDEGWVEGE